MALKPTAIAFLQKALGHEGLEELQKFELWKKKTNTVVDHEEVRTALQIVPRTILSLLQRELSQMKENDGKEIKLPVDGDATLSITKFANDVYSGEIHQAGQTISSFRYRTLPGVGLVIMTTFELYDISDLEEAAKPANAIDEKKIQEIIDERLGLRDLIAKVVDQKLSQRDAIQEMIRMKLTDALMPAPPVVIINKEESKPKKELQLKQFLEKRSKKSPPEYKIQMEKSESVSCPDCGQSIFIRGAFSGCICLGEDRKKKIHIRKTEDGVSIRFSRSWDTENIEMLLDTLRNRKIRGSYE